MVGVELGRVMPDPLLASIAERLVIGSVGPEDGPVGCDPVSPDHPIVEVIGHIPFRTDEGACRLHDSASCLRIGKANVIGSMTTMVSAETYLLSAPVERGPNASGSALYISL